MLAARPSFYSQRLCNLKGLQPYLYSVRSKIEFLSDDLNCLRQVRSMLSLVRAWAQDYVQLGPFVYILLSYPLQMGQSPQRGSICQLRHELACMFGEDCSSKHTHQLKLWHRRTSNELCRPKLQVCPTFLQAHIKLSDSPDQVIKSTHVPVISGVC